MILDTDSTRPALRAALLALVLVAAPSPARSQQADSPGTDWGSASLGLRFTPNGDLIGARLRLPQFEEEILDRPFFFEKELEEQRKASPGQEVSADRAPHRAGLFLRSGTTWPKTSGLEALSATREPVDEQTLRFEVADPSGQILPKGIQVLRTYRLDPERPFELSMEIEIRNLTADILDLSGARDQLYLELGPAFDGDARDWPEVFASGEGAIHVPSPEEELQVLPEGNAWTGIRNRYFALILHKTAGEGSYTNRKLTRVDAKGTSLSGPVVGFRPKLAFLKPQESVTFSFRLYIGLKTEEHLGPDYAGVFNNWDGITGPIGWAMFSVLEKFYALTQSYGWSILLLTLLVKLLMFPLTKKQTESMQKMTRLQPKIQKLREKYKDASQLNQEMMKLYKKYEVNPLGGCFPILLQIPIFIALYSCLQNAIQLKNVPFWWLADLSAPDPLLVLPSLFAASIYFTSKAMQPATDTSDPAQSQAAMMRWMMPLMMFVFMQQVSSGVMIYFCGQSALGILEQKVARGQISPPTHEAHEEDEVEDAPEPEDPQPAKRKKGKKGRA